jgi:proton-translocating NAD(P)+ transhydrogenase subunit beta
VLKRSMNTGFAGIENDLFIQPNTMMVLSDAKKTLREFIAGVKEEAA